MRRPTLLVWIVAASLAAVAACQSTADDACTPGRSAPCACAWGAPGAQVCGPAGMFGPCACTPEDGGALGRDATADDGPTGASVDSATDAGGAFDSGRDSREGGGDGSDAAAVDAEGAAAVWNGKLPDAGVCDPEGWCWRDPAPYPFGLSSLWASASNDVWAVGELPGVIMHWDGLSWTGEWNLPVGLVTVTGGTATDLWTPSYHATGGVWSPATLPSGKRIAAMWARALDDVWAVGQQGAVLRWNGASWGAADAGTIVDLSAVFGFGASDVFIGGANGLVKHWDGARWTDISVAGTTSAVTELRGASATQLWAVGKGLTAMWNGTTWAGEACGSGPFGGNFFVGGARIWNGTSCQTTWTLPGYLAATDIVAIGMDDYIVAEYFTSQDTGTLLRGSVSQGFSSMLTSSVTRVAGGFAAGPNDYYLIVGSSLMHGPTVVATGLGAPLAISGSSAADIWVTGPSGTVSHFDGAQWRPMALPTTANASAVQAISPSSAFVLAGGTIYSWDGASWASLVTIPGPGMWSASATNDVWYGGDVHNPTQHYDGTSWSVHEVVPLTPMASVWTNGASDAFAWNGPIYHWDGAAWTQTAPPPPGANISFTPLSAVWLADGQLWATTSRTLLHWDGVQWHADDISSTNMLLQVVARQDAGALAYGPGCGTDCVLTHAP